MTRAQVIKQCVEVRKMPFCQLEDGEGCPVLLTRREYDRQMARGDRPWTSWGGEAWYDDEASEALQDAWYVAARAARQAVREWEVAHKGTIPQWAKSF